MATVVRGEGGGTVMASQHRYPPGGGGSTGNGCSPSPVGSLSLLDGTSTLPGGSLPPPDSCSPCRVGRGFPCRVATGLR